MLTQLLTMVSASAGNGSSDSGHSENGTFSLPLDGSTVKMKGLPFKATCEDVVRFYEGFELAGVGSGPPPSSVFLKRHPDGRPNGEVRCMQQISIDSA